MTEDAHKAKAIVERTRKIQATASEINLIVASLDPPDLGSHLDTPQPQIPPDDRPIFEPNDQDSYLIVGKNKGSPGESVPVEVLARCPNVETGALALMVGCDPHLRLTGHTITDEAYEMLGINPKDPDDKKRFIPFELVQQSRGDRTVTQFISIFFGFFSKLKMSDTGTEGKVGPQYVRIPLLIPVLRLFFRIADDAPAGIRYPLDNRSFYYGKEFKGPRGGSVILRQHNMFATAPKTEKPFDHGIHPVCIGGWVDVVKSSG